MPDAIEILVQDPESFLALSPEELGAVMLEALGSCQPSTRNRNNFFIALGKTPSDESADTKQRMMEAFAEGWHWLVAEGLIAERPDNQDGFMFITRRGRQALERGAVDYLRSKLLPRQQLHPKVQQKAAGAFLRGDYDVAVLQAFKQVEIAVREAGGFPADKIGVDLMRKAFGKGGPLRRPDTHEAEEEALSNLFAGAIGQFKNPNSHRDVELAAHESVEMIMLASLLLRIVDQRAAAMPSSWPD